MRRLLLLATMATLLGSAASAQTMRIALRDDPDILDPSLARTYTGRIVFASMCDKLFDIDEKLQVVPQLALSYAWTTPVELLIKLRPDVVFQDGEKMDAEAVKYSLYRHLTMPGSFRRSEVGAMDHVEVVDPLTMKIVLKQPSAPFLSQLTDRAGIIVSPKAAEAAGKDFGLHPVCAGPFKFVERVAQDHITLERFAQYWNAGAIKLERVVFQPIPDSSVRLANLEAGSIEMSEYIVPNDVAAVEKNPKLHMAESNGLGYQGITFNLANGPRGKSVIGQDARVRRAFELSIDRTALVQVVYNGLFLTAAQAVPSGSPYHDDAVKPGARDVDKAKALLKEAGVTVPVVVNLTVPNQPDMRQAGEIIQSMAQEAGFDVKLTATEFASGLAAATRGDFESFLVGWSGRVDPDGNLYSFLHSGGALNDSKFAKPEMDAMLDQARAASDPAVRKALYAKVAVLSNQDLPILYLWQLKNLVGLSNRVVGFKPFSDGMIRLQGVSLAN